MDLGIWLRGIELGRHSTWANEIQLCGFQSTLNMVKLLLAVLLEGWILGTPLPPIAPPYCHERKGAEQKAAVLNEKWHQKGKSGGDKSWFETYGI